MKFEGGKGYEHWNIYGKILKIVKPKGKILDAGCGVGKLGEYIEGMTGVDCNKEFLNQAKNKYKKVIRADLNKLPFRDDEFNTTFCIEVLEYTKNPCEIFKELERVTKNKLIISSANYNWIEFYYGKIRGRFLGRQSQQEYLKHLKEGIVFKTKTNGDFLMSLNKKFKIYYLSNKFPKIRNLFGNYLSTEVVGILKK